MVVEQFPAAAEESPSGLSVRSVPALEADESSIQTQPIAKIRDEILLCVWILPQEKLEASNVIFIVSLFVRETDLPAREDFLFLPRVGKNSEPNRTKLK